MIFKLFPHTYTGNSFERLQNMLKERWIVKFITSSLTDKDGSIVYDYILEKEEKI